MRSHRLTSTLVLVALVGAAGACGGGDDTDDQAATTEPTTTVTPATAPPTTVTPATAPPTTVPPATAPPTTVPPATAPPTTVPPATAPPTTVSYDPAMAFRDEFDGELLAEVNWSWDNENPTRWRIEDGQLVITGDDPPVGAGAVNFLTRDVPEGLDISISTHVTATLQEDFEAAGLFLIGPDDTQVALVFGHCEGCNPTSSGLGIYVEAFRGGDPLLGDECCSFAWESDEDGGDGVRLLIEWSPEAGVAIGFFAYPDGELQRAFRLDDAPIFDRFGIAAYNLPPPQGSSTVDVEARFDWFEFRSYS